MPCGGRGAAPRPGSVAGGIHPRLVDQLHGAPAATGQAQRIAVRCETGVDSQGTWRLREQQRRPAGCYANGKGRVVVIAQSHENLFAGLAWGVGLTLGGIVVIICALAFLCDYKGMASRYCESILETRRQMPIAGRYAQGASVEIGREWC